jgi:hypothetical protein
MQAISARGIVTGRALQRTMGQAQAYVWAMHRGCVAGERARVFRSVARGARRAARPAGSVGCAHRQTTKDAGKHDGGRKRGSRARLGCLLLCVPPARNAQQREHATSKILHGPGPCNSGAITLSGDLSAHSRHLPRLCPAGAAHSAFAAPREDGEAQDLRCVPSRGVRGAHHLRLGEVSVPAVWLVQPECLPIRQHQPFSLEQGR